MPIMHQIAGDFPRILKMSGPTDPDLNLTGPVIPTQNIGYVWILRSRMMSGNGSKVNLMSGVHLLRMCRHGRNVIFGGRIRRKWRNGVAGSEKKTKRSGFSVSDVL